MEEKIEMVKLDNFKPIPRMSERRTNYVFNVPRDRITFVKAAQVQRKNQASISNSEKLQFINGISSFNSMQRSLDIAGTYGQMVSVHRHPGHRMHSVDGDVGTQRFLPWHRVYISVLEFWVHSLTPFNKFFIPYWDWTTNQSIPDWLENIKPTVNIPNTESIPPEPSSWDTVIVSRTPGQAPPPFNRLPTSEDVNNCLNKPTYTEFTIALELIHNQVHAWVGGTMSDIATSPADPLFWMHHANIDRIYTLWQKTHPDSAQTVPNLNPSNGDQHMDPFSGNEPDYRHWDWAVYV